MTEHEILNSKVVELFPSSDVLKQKLYCIVDFKSLTILPPFLAQNDEEAKRNFINLLNYSNSTLCRFPEDFKLYCLGDFAVSFTGTFDTAKEELQKYLFNFTVVASGDNCIQPDTSKYDELSKKIDDALKQVSNSNSVLVEQIGNVPNLDKAINLLNSKMSAITDEIESLKTDDVNCNCKIDSKKSFFNKLFS